MVLNSRESCFTLSFNYSRLYKERSAQEATHKLPTQSTFKENHGNTKSIGFQFQYGKFSQHKYSTIFY